MRYDMIALDLDGTLLTRDGVPSDENLRAVADAQQAGVLVVPCTGRAWRESTGALAQFPDPDVGVFVTGAAVTHVADGSTLDLSVIEPHLAMRIVELLYDLPEAVLVFRDRNVTGHDYLVTGRGSLTPVTQWWFQMTGADAHFQREVTLEDMHHALRLGIVGPGHRVREVDQRLKEALGDRILTHYFPAVRQDDPGETNYVYEVFGSGVDKWRGLSWIADNRDIDPARIAVIGDEVNDLGMLRAAGCSIAMGNAVPQAKALAHHVTRDCDEHGVAHAIHQLLDGVWG